MLPTLLHRRSRVQNPFEVIRQEMESVFDHALTPWSDNGGETEELTAMYPVDIREEDGTIPCRCGVAGF